MATWKDDEIAAEALRGVIKARRPLPRKYLLLGVPIVAVSMLAGMFFFRKRPEGATTGVEIVPAAVSVAQANAEETLRGTVEAPAPAPAPASTAPRIESDTPPPVSKPVSATPTEARPRDVTLNNARECLRVGDASGAIYQLNLKRAHALEGAEEQEAQVLLARGELAAGNMADARKKFEALAFMPSGTPAGTDALMGNYWCQAGTLARCRESELGQVAGGPESWGRAVALFEQARRIEDKSGGNLGKLEEARELYQRALDTRSLEQATEKDCVVRLTDLANRIVLDAKYACAAPNAVFHKVEAGEVLEKIAKKNKVNQGQIKQINRLSDKMSVRQGQVLKMLPGDVLYKVDRTHLHASLYIDGVFIRRFPVGIGPGNATPVGTYTVSTKVANPDWYYDGKRIPFGHADNILGTRWMGFSTTETHGQGAGLGVHGTAYPESVPGRKSKGCVRMLNKDVEELFDYMPQGGKVEIFD